MKIRHSAWAGALAAALLCAAPATAQSVSVGAGIAVPSDEIAQLPSDVRDEGWTELRSRASRGWFVEARGRFGGGMALLAGVTYNRFEEATSEYADGSGRSVTLVSSQVIVPLSIGLERTFGEGVVVPFGTLEATASYFYRAYESPDQGTPLPVSLESGGEARFGAAIGAGVRLDLFVVRLDAVVRLQLVNLFGAPSTTEATMYYLQAGLGIGVGL